MPRQRIAVRKLLPLGAVALALIIMLPQFASSAPAEVTSTQKISNIAAAGSQFGQSPASIGDLDGDGVDDLAVGVPLDDTGGTNRGAVWILLMNSDGTVSSQQKIADGVGNFPAGNLDDNDNFGQSVASLGDLDGDGVGDIAVGASRDDDGGSGRGAVWILFLNSNGTVKTQQKISDVAGGFTGLLDDEDRFGQSVTSVGDLDGDFVVDLAVGANLDDDGGSDRGAVWVLFLNSSGTVNGFQKISSTQGGFTGPLSDNDRIAVSLAAIGDMNGDGFTELAVGAPNDGDGGLLRGAVWVLFLNGDGTVLSDQKISETSGGFSGALDNIDQFGTAVANIGDLDGDGVPDLAAGASFDDDGGTDRGSVYVLFLNANGTVKSYQKISDTSGSFGGALANGDLFGSGLASFADLNGDSVADLAVGAIRDDDNGADAGAVWILFLEGPTTITLAGTVYSDSLPCNGPTAGVPVYLDLNPTNPGAQVLSTSTDVNGDYSFSGVVASGVVAELTAIIPLGFGAIAPENAQTSVTLDVDQLDLDFSLDCVDAVGEPEKLGYWKHQAKIHIKGKDKFDETFEDMSTNYPAAIFGHFYENDLNSIVVPGATFVDEGSGPVPITLDAIHETLRHKIDKSDLGKAKAEYLALLLNVASGRVQTFSVISDDNATVSQALQHIAALLNDGDESNDKNAKNLAKDINKGKLLDAGEIPLAIDNIAYKPVLGVPATFELRQNHPNPFNPNTTIEFAAPQAGAYEVAIFDVSGKLVRRYHGEAKPGIVAIRWDGTNQRGATVGSGTYFYRVVTGSFMDTRKMILAK